MMRGSELSLALSAGTSPAFDLKSEEDQDEATTQRVEAAVLRLLKSHDRIEQKLLDLSSDMREGFLDVKQSMEKFGDLSSVADYLKECQSASHTTRFVDMIRMPSPTHRFASTSTATLPQGEDRFKDPFFHASSQDIAIAANGPKRRMSHPDDAGGSTTTSNDGAQGDMPIVAARSGLNEKLFSSMMAQASDRSSRGTSPSRKYATGIRSTAKPPAQIQMRESFECNYDALQAMWREEDGTFDVEVEQLDAGEQQEDEDNIVRRHVLEPTSKIRMVLDILSLCLLSYDLIMTPYIIAWQIPWEGAYQVCTYITLVFWTCDIGFSFRTGYWDSNGQLEMRPLAIAGNYLRTFFFIDVSAVVSDLCTVVMNAYSAGRDGDDIIRFTKAARMLRLLGIMRISRVEGIFTRLCDRYPRLRTTSIVVNIFKILLLILYINHVIACAWYALGSQVGSDTGSAWVDTVANSPAIVDNPTTYRDAGSSYQYFTSFHFSLTQMTPGSMQVFPVSTYERMFNSGCLIFGLMTFSTLVSSLSSMIMSQKLRLQEHNKKFGTLHRFLREAQVTRKLAIGVEQEVKRRLLQTSILSFCNVDALKMLSPAMRAELKHGLSRQQLLAMPFLRIAGHMTPHVLRRLCRSAIDFQVVTQGDHVFESYKNADSAYALIKGGLQYIAEDSAVYPQPISDPSAIEVVPVGGWLAEATLWCHWQHAGTAIALDGGASMMMLRVQGFIDTIREETLLKELAWEYTQHFHRLLQLSNEVGISRPNDMYLGMANFDEVVLMVQDVFRIFFGLVALSILQRTAARGWNILSRGRSLGNLEEEVRGQKCTLVVTNEGDVQRLTAVACVQVTRGDGKIWVQLGKARDGQKVVATCALPGIKMQDGAIVSRVVDCVCTGELAFMGSRLRMGRIEQSVKCKFSESYGIYTKYIRHIQRATIDEEGAHECVTRIPSLLRTQSVRSGTGVGGSTKVGHNYSTISTKTPAVFDEVYVTSDGEIIYLSSWLTVEEFEFYSSPAGAGALQKWLQATKLYDGTREAAHKAFQNAREQLLQKHTEENGMTASIAVEAPIQEEADESRASTRFRSKASSSCRFANEEAAFRLRNGAPSASWTFRELAL